MGFSVLLGSKQRRMTLGSANAITAEKARKGYCNKDGKDVPGAEQLHARVKLGQDPASDKAEAQAQAAQTFAAAVAEYLPQKRPQLKGRSYPDLERHLLKQARSLHELQLAKISLRDVAAVLTSITNKAGTVTANRVRSSLSTFFAWAMTKGLVQTNPVIGTERHYERSRERVLKPDELRTILKALPNDHYGDILRLLALTGQRAGEIAGLRWSEITENAITLPSDRTKNGRAHIVPLSQPARTIIEKQQHRPGRDLIFGIGSGPFSGWSHCKKDLDDRIVAAGGKSVPHWVPHDFRRTVATGMAKLGVQPHVIEATLNHVSGTISGVAAVYNRNTYEPEKRTALDLWADHLMAIVEGRESNVTLIRRPA